MIHVVSVRTGDKYGIEYAEILHDMAARNLSAVDQMHWSISDETPEGVNPIEPDPSLPGWWQKVRLFAPDMPWSQGDRIVYLDLDIVVTGRLEDLAETKGIVRDHLWPCYNSSVMVWDHGEHRDIWDRFDPSSMDQPGSVVPPECLPKGQINGGDQEWITQVGGWDVLPRRWCVPYRTHAVDWPPNESKVILFNGKPKPHEITEGWVATAWKVGGLTSLPKMTGMNVTRDFALDNVRANVLRDIPWFSGFGRQSKSVCIVGGAPSMLANIDAIRQRKRDGCKLVALNNAWRTLQQHQITPDAIVMLDAREENVEFVQDGPDVKYFIASQCHPGVFNALQHKDVVLWHNLVGDNEELRQILEPWWEGPRPIVGVPGGCTVALRALWLCQLSGYRRIHVYGMDSCYSDDAHHAYAQPLNDGEDTLLVRMGTGEYRCSRWMARQAEEFRETFGDLQSLGVQVFVHGSGLIPDMCRSLRMERAA
jgi:hypothetical protein